MDRRYIEIHWSAADEKEAEEVCRFLVEDHLVACAQMIPGVDSFYIWKGELARTQEIKVILKTRTELFEKVNQAIISRSRYEVPEVVIVPIVGGNQAYLDWIDEME